LVHFHVKFLVAHNGNVKRQLFPSILCCKIYYIVGEGYFACFPSTTDSKRFYQSKDLRGKLTISVI